MTKTVTITGNRGKNTGEKLKGIEISLVDSDMLPRYTSYSIYYNIDTYNEAGGIKRIDRELINQGGTDWKEGDDPAKALSIFARVLDHLSEAEKIEVTKL
jgi:hypothetical protein